MEDLKQIQEFFSKPLNEEKEPLDIIDLAKVVKAVQQTGHPVTVLLVPKFNEIEVLTGMNAPDDMLRDLSNAVDSLGYGRNDIIIAGDSSNLSRREYSDIRRVNGGHKDYFEESVNEMDMNDPILMKMRAAKDKLAKMRAANAGDDGNDKFFDAAKLRALKKKRAQVMRDMEQESEMEGGPIADKYGDMLNKIDKAIAMLNEATKKEYNALLDKEYELTKAYSKDKTDANWKKLSDIRKKGKKLEKELEDQGLLEVSKSVDLNEYDARMPSQEEVDKFFALTQNETHYLNSKPVAGQEATFNLMKVEPWDEYDLSNWNSLVRKAKAKGKSLAEDKSYARVSMPRFVKDKNNPNFLNVYIDYDLGPGGASIAFGKETMTGQIRRESAAEAMRLADDVARDLEAEYDLEDIDIQDLKNGKVRIFAVSDDFINMNPNMLSEGASTEEKRMAMQAIKRFAKYRGVSEKEAKADLLRAIKELGSIEEAINEIVETIQAGKVLEEKLCKKGEAYRKRRMAAGEKSSAYLSGRAVKVCKGQMSGKLFENELDDLGDELAAAIEDKLEDKKGEIKEVVDPISILSYILAGTTLTNIIAKYAGKLFKKYNFGKGEEAAKKIYNFTHKLENDFKSPIKRVIGLFTKDEKAKTIVTDALFILLLLALGGLAGTEALVALKKGKLSQASVSALKAGLKGKDIATVGKEIAQTAATSI